MPSKIGLVLALDGEREFTQAMKNASQSAKQTNTALKDLQSEFKGSTNSIEYLTQRQEKLKTQQEAYARVLNAAKTGQANARKAYKEQADALEELKKKQEEAQKALEKMDKSDPGYAKQKKEVDDLTRAVGDQTAEYLKAEGRLSSWDAKVTKAEGDIKKNSTALQKNEKYMYEAAKSADGCAKSIDGMGKEIDQTSKSADKGGQSLKTFLAVTAANLAASALKELGKQAIAAAKYCVEVGSKFQASMSKVQALSGASTREMSAMEAMAKELGRTTMFSASEVADGFSYMALAGWGAQESVTAMPGVLNLAAAAQMDLGQASDMVTDYLSAFGLEASDATRMADMLAYAQAHSNTSATQLGEAYSNCAANMHAAGQSIETTTAFLEAFANQGEKGSGAGTKLSAIMRDITSKMKDGKIQIGDTSVAVMDANGNFRSLTDIMRDVETATNGMGDAERSAALQATFTAKSVSGVNMILTEGVDKIAGYADALTNSDGAASSMATTMTDNLSGAITEFNSATEGLGIAVFDYIKGPAQGIVEGATAAINAVTDAITPQKTEMDEFVELIKAKNEEVQALLDSADAAMQQGEEEAGKIEYYKNMLLGFQEVIKEGGELDPFQIFQAQKAVDELKGYMPGLAAAFDETTGAINLTNQELVSMFDNTEALVKQQAYMKAQRDAYEGLAEAELNKASADAAVEQATQKLNEAQEANAQTTDYLRGGYGDLYKDVVDAQSEVDKTTKTQKEANKSLEEAQEKVELTDRVVKQLTEENGNLVEAQEGVADSADGAADSESALGDAAGDTAETIEEAAEREKQAAEQMRKAHEDALNQITDAYESAKKQIEGSFDIDPIGEAWTGGVDRTVEAMIEVLDADMEAMLNYERNLDLIKDHVGKEIAPEFMSYLLSLGEDGANTLQHIVSTFDEDGGAEKVAALSDKYVAGLDKREEIASAMAANTVAMQLGLGEMGSTDKEWDNLTKTVTAKADTVTKETAQAFLKAKDQAKKIGIAIPDGLAESIRSSDAPETAVQQATDVLNAAISGRTEGILEMAKAAGLTVPEGIAEGLNAGGEDAVAAYQQLVDWVASADTSGAAEAGSSTGAEMASNMASSISEGADAAASAASDTVNAAQSAAGESATGFSEVGNEASSAFATGFANNQIRGAAAGNLIATTARNAIISRYGEFTTAGTSASAAFASGIAAGGGAAAGAASGVASVAVASMNNSGGAYSVGYNIAAGMASGIRSGGSAVISAAASVAAAALDTAKARLAIKSPSQVFRDQVGKQITAGWAFGIKRTASSVTKEVENVASKTVTAATKWLAAYRKRQSVSALQEAWFWSRVISTAKQGTNAYEKVIDKWEDAIIRANFGVSRTETKTTGSGKNKKTTTTTKSAEDYYAEILKAAETWFTRLQIREDTSIKQELSYWTKVRKQLNSGTDAYVQASEKIKSLKQEIGSMDVAEEALSSYQTYYDASLRAIMQYWNTVRWKYAAGTADRIRADQNYLDARKAYLDKLADIEDDYASKIEDANARYTEAVEERTESIMRAFDLFEAFESESVSGEELLFNMQAQAAGYAEWRKTLSELEGRGITGGLLSSLQEAGPNQIASLKALMTLTDEQLKAFQKAYEEKERQARAQAEYENKDLKKSVADEIKQLKEAEKAEIKEVKTAIDSGLLMVANNIRSIAADQTSALVAAFRGTAGQTQGGVASGSVGKNVSQATLNAADLDPTFKPAAATTTKKAATTTTAKAATTTTKAPTAAEKKAIQAAIETGNTKRSRKLTAAEEKGHHELWIYLANKYLRSATDATYRALGKALGVSLSNTITIAQRDALLKALKAKGFASGSRALSADGLIWMDELLESQGPEMIVRQSDRAILTRARAGDAIIPSNLADNLFGWGAIEPTAFMNMAELNRRLVDSTASQQASAQRSEEMMAQMVQLMQTFMPYLAERMNVSIDGRKLVSATSDYTSQDMAMRSRRRRA